jgi:hypothetical protein
MEITAMACSVPICYLLHRIARDGTEGLLMEPDLPSALTDAARGEQDGSWRAESITIGRDIVLRGEALREAIAARRQSQHFTLGGMPTGCESRDKTSR